MSMRATIVAAGVVATTSLAAAVIMASPAEAPTLDEVARPTVRVVTPSVAPSQPYRPTPRVTPTHEDRKGSRGTLTPSPLAKPTVSPTARIKASAPRDIRISRYATCYGTANAQWCIGAGSLTLYAPTGTPILAGHNYMGYAWLDDLAVGRRVIVANGPVAGTYRVFGHARVGYQGGNAPSFQGAALVLQTCAGSGTGFSLLERM